MSCHQVEILNYNHSIVALSEGNTLVITDNNKCTSITIPQPVTCILQVNSPGPQGPAGPSGSQGPAGSSADTGSLLTTASFNQYTSSNTSQFAGTSSYATTASYALNAGTTINTSSFVTTSSFNAFTSSYNTFTGSYNTGSFSGSFTGSLLGTASFATTASFALNAGGAGFPFTGNAVITGSLLVSGSGIIVTGSLTISGSTTQFLAENGTRANPAYAFTNATSSGFRYVPGGGIEFVADGAQALIAYSNSWRFNTSVITLRDSLSGNTVLAFRDATTTANAPSNYIRVVAVSTGSANNPRIETISNGTQADISLDLAPRGTGSINVLGPTIISGSTTITGSLTVTSGSTEFQVLGTGTKIGNSAADTHTVTGSLNISGSTIMTGSLNVSAGITGSLQGTASWATNAVFATTAGNGGVTSVSIVDGYPLAMDGNQTTGNVQIKTSYTQLTQIISQTIDNAPTIDYTPINTTGYTYSWGRDVAAGVYTLTADGGNTPFTSGKTAIQLTAGNSSDKPTSLSYEWLSSSAIKIYVWDLEGSTLADGLLVKATLDIKIFP